MSLFKNIKFGKNTIITALVILSLALVGFGVNLELNQNNGQNAQAAYNAGANRYDDSLTALGQTATYTYNYENTAPDAAPGYFEISLDSIIGSSPVDIVSITSITDTFPIDGTTFQPLSGATTITTAPTDATYFVGTTMKVRVSPQVACTPVSGAGCAQTDIPASVPGKLVLQMQIKPSAATNTSIVDGQGKIYFPNGFDMNAIGWRVNVNYTAGTTNTPTLSAGTATASGTTGSPLSPITGLTGTYSGPATLTLPGGGTITGDIAGGTFTPASGQNLPTTTPLTGNSTLTPTGTDAPAAVQIPTTLTNPTTNTPTLSAGTATASGTTGSPLSPITGLTGTYSGPATLTLPGGGTITGDIAGGTFTPASGQNLPTTTPLTGNSTLTPTGTDAPAAVQIPTTLTNPTTNTPTLSAGTGQVTGTLGGLLNPITGLGGTYSGTATLTLPGGGSITGNIASNTFTPNTGQTIPSTTSTTGVSTLTPTGSNAPAAVTLTTLLSNPSTTGTPIALSNIGTGSCNPTSVTVGSSVTCTFPITTATTLPAGGISAIVNTSTGGYASCSLSGTTLTCSFIPTVGASTGSQPVKLSVAGGTYTDKASVTVTAVSTSTSKSGTTTSGTTTSGTTTSGTTTSSGSNVSLNVSNSSTYLVTVKAVPEQIAIGGAISFQGKILSGPGSVAGQVCEFNITKPNGTKAQINKTSDATGNCNINLSSSALISLLGIQQVSAQSLTPSLISGIVTDFNTVAGNGSVVVKISGTNAVSNTAPWRVLGSASAATTTTSNGTNTPLARTGGVLWISVGLGLALISALLYFGFKTRKSKLDEKHIDLVK